MKKLSDPIWWGGALYGTIEGKLRKTSIVQQVEEREDALVAVTKNTEYQLVFSGEVLREAFDKDNSGDPQ